jgi:SAM-dependent methyltransferase
VCNDCSTNESFNPPSISWQIGEINPYKSEESIHLDFGGGVQPRNPFHAKVLMFTDIQILESHSLGKFVHMPNSSHIPLDDNFIDSISAFDVLEHIPRIKEVDGKTRFPFVEIMNEIHRVLKPGGIFIAVTPGYPSSVAFQDPTHVNIITVDTVKYFDEQNWAKSLGYGYNGNFRLINQSWIYHFGLYNRKELNPVGKFLIIIKVLIKFSIRRRSHILWVLQKGCDENNSF